MPRQESFPELIARVKAGESSAATEIFNRFARRLIGLARMHLDSRVRQKIDPEDVLQSAFKSFFLRHADGQFVLNDWDDLWSLLVTITLRKCGHQIEHYRAACRDVGREQLAPEDSAGSWQALAKDPSPAEATLLAEAVTQLLSSLGDERERRMVELSLQGYSVAEVSAEVGRSERTVQRVLGRVCTRLQRMRDSGTIA